MSTVSRRATTGFIVVVAGLVALVRIAAQAPEPLVQSSDLQYMGAFRLPTTTNTTSFQGAGWGLTYIPSRNSLIAIGHLAEGMAGEFDIPPTPSTAHDLTALPVANLTASQFFDPLEGKIGDICPSQPGALMNLGGFLAWNSSLVVTAYVYYDAGYCAVGSHFARPLNFSSTGQVTGPYRVGTTDAGYVGGYMAPIPAEWQGALGGTAFTGLCCIPISSRTSQGPTVTVFDPGHLSDAASSKMVLGYDLQHPVPQFTHADQVWGVVAPPGTRSVLFFGSHGTPANECYGVGTSINPPPADACYDPTTEDKGYHSYPYNPQVWAYDVNDLIAVKNGSQQANALTPYAMWTPPGLAWDLPGHNVIRGAAFDPSTGRIFLSVESASEYDGRPLIHVLKVTRGGGGGTPPPPPTNLHIVP